LKQYIAIYVNTQHVMTLSRHVPDANVPQSTSKPI